MVDILDEDVDLFDSLDTEVPYHCETNLGAIGENLYKFRDDSVRSRRSEQIMRMESMLFSQIMMDTYCTKLLMEMNHFALS